jgi:predicted kinase
MAEILLPPMALVVLIGVSGSGKSTFAAHHFGSTEVLSSDAFRAIVADDAADQGASRAAFELLHLATRRRLERGRLTVIDATNVTRRARSDLLALASAAHRPAVALILDPPLAVCLRRNTTRPGRTVAEAVVRRQYETLRGALDIGDGLAAEGFAVVHRVVDPDPAVVVTVVPNDGRDVASTVPSTIDSAHAPRRAVDQGGRSDDR